MVKNNWIYGFEQVPSESDSYSSVMFHFDFVRTKYTNRYVDGLPEEIREVLFEDVMIYLDDYKAYKRPASAVQKVMQDHKLTKTIKFIGKYGVKHLSVVIGDFSLEWEKVRDYYTLNITKRSKMSLPPIKEFEKS